MRKRGGGAFARANGLVVRVLPLEDAARMVTLEEPGAGAERARGAFARLRPPPDTDPATTAAWRDLVAREAIAVRVVPPARSAAVPTAATRAGEPGRSVRDEALELARESGDGEVVEMVEGILSEVERG